MKTFTSVAIATCALVGIAGAQPAGSGAAKGAPAVPKDGIKRAPPPDAKPATPKMELPKVPQELTDLAKQVVGTWRCKGDSFEMDGAKAAMTATVTTKADLNKWWLVDTLDAKGKVPFKFIAYTTYDGTAKKWRRVMVDNMGGSMVGTADGVKDGKVTFNMDAWSPMGASQFRDYTDMSDAKAGVKMWGEMSIDKGKTWAKVYEMSCKK